MIYFIKNCNTGHIKIGVGSEPLKRLTPLQTGSSRRLDVLAVAPGGQDVERSLHQKFASQRLHGEWFKPSKELLQEISRLTGHSVEGIDASKPSKPQRIKVDTDPK